MENYFVFNQKTLTSLGVNFEDQGRKFAKPLRMTVAIVISLSTVQSFLVLLTAKVFDLLVVSALTVGLYDLYGCFKFLAVTKNIEKLRELKIRLAEMMRTLSKQQSDEDLKFMNRCRKITKTLFVTNLTCIWIFNLLPERIKSSTLAICILVSFQYYGKLFSSWFLWNSLWTHIDGCSAVNGWIRFIRTVYSFVQMSWWKHIKHYQRVQCWKQGGNRRKASSSNWSP